MAFHYPLRYSEEVPNTTYDLQPPPSEPEQNEGQTVPPALSTSSPHVIATLTPRPEEPIEVLEKKKHRSDIKNVVISVVIILMAPLIAIFLTAFVFQSYQVDGPSMETTLFNGDRLIVWKAPKTLSKITHNPYIPNRGDVIIFDESGFGTYEDGSDTKQLVKRVIGLPGDRVAIKDGVITVYNQDNPKGFNPDETLPYGSEHPFPDTEDELDIRLTDNQLFVCGDNRTNSLDSRAFGPITTDQVVGKLILRILPLSKAKVF